MSLRELENLVALGSLHREDPVEAEIAGLIATGSARLSDSRNTTLSLASRFDLAYNASHALSLAALRVAGYRSSNRYQVFQCLPHTLGLSAEVWRVLAKGHQLRNQGEYEGFFEIDDRLIEDLIDAAERVERAVRTRVAE